MSIPNFARIAVGISVGAVRVPFVPQGNDALRISKAFLSVACPFHHPKWTGGSSDAMLPLWSSCRLEIGDFFASPPVYGTCRILLRATTKGSSAALSPATLGKMNVEAAIKLLMNT